VHYAFYNRLFFGPFNDKNIWEALLGIGDAYAALEDKNQVQIYFEKALVIDAENLQITSRIMELKIP